MTNLTTLSLRSSATVPLLDQIRRCKQLTWLDISRNGFLYSFHMLSPLTNLRHLDLSYVGLSNDVESKSISFLTSLANLQTLLLTANYLHRLDELSTLDRLEQLDVSYNQLTDFVAFESMSRLDSLNLDRQSRELTTLSLHNAPSLRSLCLTSCKVRSLSFLSPLTSLQSLTICDNDISHLNDLRSHTKLTSLDVYISVLSFYYISVYESKKI